MADPGVSTQNFLRLLLGGAQKGADVLQQRQTMQQQQQPDLMLALQQMMQRKSQIDREQGLREQQLEFDAEGRSQARADQGNEQIYNTFSEWRKGMESKAKLDLSTRLAEAEINRKKAMAAYYAGRKPAGGESASKRRSAIQSALNALDKNEVVVDADAYNRFPEKGRLNWEAVRDQGGNVVGYKYAPPELKRRRGALLKELDGVGGPDTSQGVPGIVNDLTDIDSLLEALPDE